MRRALVTGGLGFIGSRLSERLVADGWDVVIVDDLSSNAVWHVRGAHLWEGSIAEFDDASDMYGPIDAIFHLASPVGPLGVMEWAGRLAPRVVADAQTVAGWTMGCPLIDVSTSEVYGSGSVDREGDDCTFRAPASARKEYAVAKLTAETMLRNTAGLDVRIVRPFNVAGPRQRAEGGFALPRFIAQALAGDPLTVYQPGTQRRAFTHVDDIVDGLLLVLERGRPGEAYNLGNPSNACDILTLAREVVAATGSRSPISVVDPRDLHGPAFAEAPEKIPDPSKAVHELGWLPWRDRARCIADALAAVGEAVPV